MPSIDEETAVFIAALDATPGVWRSLDVRTAAVRRADVWENVVTLVTLSDEAPDATASDSVFAATASVVAVRTQRPFSTLSTLIQDVAAGSHVIAGFTVVYDRELGPRSAPYTYANASIAGQLRGLSAEHRLTVVGHELLVSGQQISTVLDTVAGRVNQIDHELRAAEEPWDGFSALLEYAIGWGEPLSQYSAQFRVRAPLSLGFRH